MTNPPRSANDRVEVAFAQIFAAFRAGASPKDLALQAIAEGPDAVAALMAACEEYFALQGVQEES